MLGDLNSFYISGILNIFYCVGIVYVFFEEVEFKIGWLILF